MVRRERARRNRTAGSCSERLHHPVPLDPDGRQAAANRRRRNDHGRVDDQVVAVRLDSAAASHLHQIVHLQAEQLHHGGDRQAEPAHRSRADADASVGGRRYDRRRRERHVDLRIDHALLPERAILDRQAQLLDVRFLAAETACEQRIERCDIDRHFPAIDGDRV